MSRYRYYPLPCPFCHALPDERPWHGGAKTKTMVQCINEYCHAAPSVTGGTRVIAIKRWNDRGVKAP